MTGSKHIYYINTYFEYLVLTKIHSAPNYYNLKTIKDKIRTNSTSVSSELGGGTNGNLGLISTNTEYVMVSEEPYVRPIHPGPFVLPTGVGITNFQREIARDQHNKDVRIFNEVIDVEKSLIKQLV